jgi:hypothetical protein
VTRGPRDRRPTLAVAAILASALAATAAPQPCRAEDPAPAAPAGPTDPIAQAHKLADEAKEYERVAGDGDAEVQERKTARKGAFERLKKARDLLDQWLDKHPNDAEKLDSFYCEVASRLYWVKKMGAIDEFVDKAPSPPSGQGPGASTGPAPAGDGGGSKPPGPDAKPAPPTAAQALAAIDEYAKAHSGDVPGLCERYEDFLAKYPDASTPEYARAITDVEALRKKLKDVYRLVHDDDPDSIKNVDSAQTEKLLAQLLEDLDHGVLEVRERAAKFLGALGSGKAADPLIKTMKKERSGPVFMACVDSLGRIGGRRVCERLVKEGGEPEIADAVVHILEKILERGGAEGRVAGEALGAYAGGVDPGQRGPLFEALSNAGAAGALGLARAIEYAPAEDVAKLVEKLPDAGDPRVVTHIGKLMIVNPPGIRAEHASAARRAIEKIGKPGVRYLIPNLDDPKVSVWTAELLQRITGQKMKDNKRKTWEQWFRMNRKAVEGR